MCKSLLLIQGGLRRHSVRCTKQWRRYSRPASSSVSRASTASTISSPLWWHSQPGSSLDWESSPLQSVIGNSVRWQLAAILVICHPCYDSSYHCCISIHSCCSTTMFPYSRLSKRGQPCPKYESPRLRLRRIIIYRFQNRDTDIWNFLRLGRVSYLIVMEYGTCETCANGEKLRYLKIDVTFFTTWQLSRVKFPMARPPLILWYIIKQPSMGRRFLHLPTYETDTKFLC